jgi:hypothetical protein
MKAYPLNPVEHLFTGTGSQPITFAFAYPKLLDPQSLEKSLSETLVYFPLLRSQLVKGSAGNYEFQLSDRGLTFHVRESDDTFAESNDIESYIVPVNSSQGNPLTKITLTQTSGGSVLAVSVSHALVDGFSYFHFFSAWARNCKGESFIRPSLEREVLFSGGARSEKAITSHDIYTRCGLFHGARRSPSPKGPVPTERFFIPRDTIRSILAKTREEPGRSLTENDIVTAFLWKKYLPLWCRNQNDPQTFVTCPCDLRRVLNGLPRNYFGCALSFATASIELNRLREAEVADLALLVRDAIRNVKKEYVLKSLETLARFRLRRGVAAMAEIHLRHPQHGIIVTNLTRLPLQSLDFGAGTPTGFLSYIDVLGGAAILPALDGVEILVAPPSQ